MEIENAAERIGPTDWKCTYLVSINILMLLSSRLFSANGIIPQWRFTGVAHVLLPTRYQLPSAWAPEERDVANVYVFVCAWKPHRSSHHEFSSDFALCICYIGFQHHHHRHIISRRTFINWRRSAPSAPHSIFSCSFSVCRRRLFVLFFRFLLIQNILSNFRVYDDDG